MTFVLACVLFYLIGSFPTAYILVKVKHKKLLTLEGSGNIGARNTYEVTNSKLDSIIVLLVDFLKGFFPVIWFLNYSGFEKMLVIFPSLFLLIGHNYSIFLKFRGGRGLATAAGIMSVINFTLILLWLIFYLSLNKVIRNVHISTVIALILLPISVIFLQNYIIKFNNHSLIEEGNEVQFLFSFCSSVSIIILLKHITPILQYIKNKSNSNSKN